MQIRQAGDSIYPAPFRHGWTAAPPNGQPDAILNYPQQVVDISTTWLNSARHQHKEAAVLWLLRDITQRQQVTQQLQAAYDESER